MMNKIQLTFLISFLFASQIFAQLQEKIEPPYIRTVQFRGATDQSQLPIIRLGDRLQLSFDALNGKEEDFYYTLTHHDFDWSPSDLSKSEYLDGFDDVRITSYENSLNSLQIYSHYTISIRNRDTRRLKRSGYNLMSILKNYGK